MKNLRTFMILKGFKTKDVAAHIGVSDRTVQRYMNQALDPPLTTVIKIADLLGVSIDELVGISKIK